MENLDIRPPRELRFDDPKKAPMSSTKIVSIKPTTSNSVSSASSSDSIQFKLPSSGMLKCASMYVKYDLDVTVSDSGSGGITATGAVADEFAPDASIFARMKVFSSDGTQVSDIANYNSYCSIMNRLKKNRDEANSRGSIVRGCGVAPDESADIGTLVPNQHQYTHGADGGDAVSANELAIRRQEGANRNYRLLTQGLGVNGSGVAGNKVTLCHRIQGGLLDHETGHYLPTFAMGSGYQLQLDLADAKEAFRVVGNNASGKLGAVDAVNNASSCSYSLTNIELVVELGYFDSSVFSAVNEMLCDGIKLRHPRVKTQVNSVTSTSNNIQLSEHGRSINYLVAGCRNTANTSSFFKTTNDYLYAVDGTNKVLNLQTQIGSEVLPSQPITYGSQSFLELERAVSGKNEKFEIGNQINSSSYFKNNSKGEAVSGDALFGVSFMSHADHQEVMSGKSSSSGSIPLSLQLDFTGTPSNCELFSVVVSDQITELLHDGSCIISR